MSENLVELELSPEDAYQKAFYDINFFSSLAIPGVMRFPWPPYYIAIFQLLVRARTAEDRERILRFALGLPRGFAKTTFVKVLICWFIVYDYATFVLVICATEPLSYNFTADVSSMLGSPTMEAIYGRWKANLAIDSKELKKGFYRKRPVILGAVGAGTSMRGLNIEHERPDLMIFDDAQTKENAKSPAESASLLEWFVGTALKAVSYEFAMVLYIGNMYPGQCILYKLKESRHWISLITGCILSNQQSLWPEVHPLPALFESWQHDEEMGLGDIWFSEMMNDPIVLKYALLPDGSIPESPYSEIDLQSYSGAFTIIDPAGFRKKSDDNVVCTSYLIDGKPVVVEMDGGIWNPEQTILKALSQCVRLGSGLIGVEATAYQQTLAFWINKYKVEHNLPWIEVVELSPRNSVKESRIRAYVDSLLSRSAFIHHPDARAKFVWQAIKYKLGTKDNRDDWLDCPAYTPQILAEHMDKVLAPVARHRTSMQASVVPNNTFLDQKYGRFAR